MSAIAVKAALNANSAPRTLQTLTERRSHWRAHFSKTAIPQPLLALPTELCKQLALLSAPPPPPRCGSEKDARRRASCHPYWTRRRRHCPQPACSRTRQA
eukprot:6182890-Pleurochrysis_carterae.AAC.6